VGQYFQGDMNYLTFGNDQDIANPDAIGEFRNIMLCEESDGICDTLSTPKDGLTGHLMADVTATGDHSSMMQPEQMTAMMG